MLQEGKGSFVMEKYYIYTENKSYPSFDERIQTRSEALSLAFLKT